MRTTNFFRVVLFLVLLGFFIYFIDYQLISGFLSQAKTEKHFLFLFFLLLGVSGLIAFVLYSDKKSSE